MTPYDMLPTFVGRVNSVTGATVGVNLAPNIASGMVIIGATAYRVGLVGSFVRIPQGYHQLYGVVSETTAVNLEGTERGSVNTGRSMTIQLVGESIGGAFERGISQYPRVNDEVHMVTDEDLHLIYDLEGPAQVPIGRLASAESLTVKVDLNALVSRHSAVLGSTGSGKSTTIASLLRSITQPPDGKGFPNARILLLDVHGEYGEALKSAATVFRVHPHRGQQPLHIPYWMIDASDLIAFLTGGVSDTQERFFLDRIATLKRSALETCAFPGVTETSLTVDTPIPFSLRKLWHELMDEEVRTYDGPNRDQPCLENEGDPAMLIPPRYRPHAMGSKGPFINPQAPGIRRQLDTVRSRLLDRRYAFMLQPGPWDPTLDGTSPRDLPDLLRTWLRCEKPISILDLSGIPSGILSRLVGSILKIVYEALFWSSDQSVGGRERPLLVVMEEAHRYLNKSDGGPAREMVQRIVKEGRKYGIGAMVVSQRPAEVDETILSQCGTFVALRTSNPNDRAHIQGSLPDNLAGLLDMLPVLRTGEAIITGEAARLPIRCRITLPEPAFRPKSSDPPVAEQWTRPLLDEEYGDMAAAWRAQSQIASARRVEDITKHAVEEANSR
ncbi:MAG: ATP-binding protein [Myxococcales bacterium]|nr:ATP-binding protein [Myxococcales bacterium]